MIKDLLKFQLDLKHFQEVVVPENHHALMKRIAIQLYDSVTDGTPGTPKDTGWHRANWGVKIGRNNPPTHVEGEYPEDKRGLYQPMPRTAYFDVHNIIAITPLGPSPFIWMYNNAPGICALEDGHSKKQAPTGMLFHALNEVQEFMDVL
jgi:hypothetical protein